jgi:pimeloyl-ACP methyl ester carboxylesterase
MEPRSQQVETSDGAIASFWTLGDSGDTVVLLPAVGRSGRDFDIVARLLVRAGFNTAAVDLRGVGNSTGSLDDITLHDLAADVARVIESLDCGPVHVVGHAFGNRVARCLAADRPNFVRSVTLLAAGGLIPPEAQAFVAMARSYQLDLPDPERLEAVKTAWFAPSSDPTVWRNGWWPGAAPVHVAAGSATPTEDWWDAGRAPLLVIQGLDDQIAPPANGHALRDQLGDRVSVIDLTDAGHALLVERPHEIAEAMITFIRKH